MASEGAWGELKRVFYVQSQEECELMRPLRIAWSTTSARSLGPNGGAGLWRQRRGVECKWALEGFASLSAPTSGAAHVRSLRRWLAKFRQAAVDGFLSSLAGCCF